MKDFAGIEIDVGDIVAYIESGYRNFSKAHVTKITEKKVALGDTTRFGIDVIILKKVTKE